MFRMSNDFVKVEFFDGDASVLTFAAHAFVERARSISIRGVGMMDFEYAFIVDRLKTAAKDGRLLRVVATAGPARAEIPMVQFSSVTIDVDSKPRGNPTGMPDWWCRKFNRTPFDYTNTYDFTLELAVISVGAIDPLRPER